jgi:hypothetical protein
MRTRLANAPALLPGVLLGLFVLAAVPVFVCLPLWADVTLYDLAARNLLQGGVPYRDVFDTNPPGMVWLHAGVRSLFGWRSEAIRLVDLAVVATIAGLLARCLRRDGAAGAPVLWTVLALAGFYLGTSEGSHCQRDVWMLLPALLAAELRLRRWERAGRAAFLPAAAEGLLWGAACWIKPFVLVPACACWLALLPRRGPQPARVGTALLGLAAGLTVALAAGLAWMAQAGALPSFLEVVTDWLPEYARRPRGWAARVAFPLGLFRPWGLLHLPAVPLALTLLATPREPSSHRRVLAGLYLGWLLQAAFLQKDHEYVLVPTILLGIPLLAGELARAGKGLVSRVALAGVTVVVAASHPLVRAETPHLWARCWQEGSTAELRDDLRRTGDPLTTDWVDLERVAAFLRAQGLADGQLTCYHDFTHPLLLELRLRPSTPFLHFNILLSAFPRHHDVIRRRLETSGQVFVVSDVQSVGITRADIERNRVSLPPEWSSVYPWSEPVVFRSGRYLVHRVVNPVARLAPEPRPMARRPKRSP